MCNRKTLERFFRILTPIEKNLPNLPQWVFLIDEISAGVYKVLAKHVLGPSIEMSGPDPDELFKKAAQFAERMEQDFKS